MDRDRDRNSDRDNKRRFLFEEMDVRGEIVHIDSVLSQLRAIHDYPSGVANLLGEFVVASLLLASTLKFRGTLTVQARSERQIPLIMAEATDDLAVRAIARGAQEAVAMDFPSLLGGGQLVLTVTPTQGKRYQGIVPLADESLAKSIDSYFEQSEQLQTRLYLASDGEHAAGLLLQQLPAQLVTDANQRNDQWDHLRILADTLGPRELLDLADASLLQRLYQNENLRLFDPQPVAFKCSCSRERTLAALASIGEGEIRSILDEQGSVTMDCEFCNQRYVFSPEDLQDLLSTPGTASLH